MRSITLGVAAGLCLAAFASPASAQDQSKIQMGMTLFSSQKCTMCHSIGAKGNPKGPLDTVVAKTSPEELRQWITDPDAMRAKTNATRMPPMKQLKLTKEQVDALVAYLTSLKATNANAR
jgi:mono/diheme cytochrome c family protein